MRFNKIDIPNSMTVVNELRYMSTEMKRETIEGFGTSQIRHNKPQ